MTGWQGIYLKNLDILELVEKARGTVMGLASLLLREDHDLDVSYIALDLPCTFFMLRSLRSACTGSAHRTICAARPCGPSCPALQPLSIFNWQRNPSCDLSATLHRSVFGQEFAMHRQCNCQLLSAFYQLASCRAAAVSSNRAP